MIAELKQRFDIESDVARDLISSAEPLWNAMESAGGFVDSWGGGEFCVVFPQTLSFIREAANP